MKAYLFYGATISFLVGVFIRSLTSVTMPGITWLFFVGFCLLLLWRRRSESASSSAVLFTSVAMCFCACGLLRMEIATWQFGQSELEEKVGDTVLLQGLVLKEPDVRETATNIYLTVGDDVILVRTERGVDIAYGDEVQVVGILKKPETFVSEFGREFNYPAYLLVRKVEYQISYAEVDVLSSNNGNFFLDQLLRMKYALMESIERSLEEPYAGLGEGLLLGVKQGLGEDLESVFRTSGIIHIVVLSRYNILLVVSFVLFILSYIFSRRLQLVCALGAVAVFALLVGLSATVVRASVMAGLLLFAQLIGRTYDVLRALLFAGTLMVFTNPHLLVFDIGFQLSFMATLGLLLVAPRFETFISEGFKTFQIKDFLVATIATQIAVLPLLLYYIGEISIVAIIVNVLVLPFVPLAMLATATVGLVGLVLPLASAPFAFVAHYVLSYIIAVATLFADLPFASFLVPVIPAWSVVVLYGALGLVLWYLSLSGKKNQTLQEWVVEDEDGVRAKVAGELRSPATADTPLFFR